MLDKIIRETYRKILSEAGSSPLSQTINNAIDNARRVVLTYPDSVTDEPIKRDLYIYSYGRKDNNLEYIRCFQVGNGGSSGGFKWKIMRVDKIIDIKLTRFKIPMLPDNVPSYRLDGDKDIPFMYNMVDADKIKQRSFVKDKQKFTDKTSNNDSKPQVDDVDSDNDTENLNI